MGVAEGRMDGVDVGALDGMMVGALVGPGRIENYSSIQIMLDR